MDRSGILSIVADVIRAQFEEPSLDVRTDSVVEDFPDWDSVAQVQILVALESRFGIRFSADEFSELSDVAGLVDCVARRLAGADA